MRTLYENVPLAFTTVVNPEAAVAARALPSASFPPSLSIWPYLNATLLEQRCYSDVTQKQESEELMLMPEWT